MNSYWPGRSTSTAQKPLAFSRRRMCVWSQGTSAPCQSWQLRCVGFSLGEPSTISQYSPNRFETSAYHSLYAWRMMATTVAFSPATFFVWPGSACMS